jgi:hypothetical protein
MKKFFAIVALALTLSACAVTSTPTPTTPAMRLVQADGAYKALVATVKEGVIRGSIAGENAVRVKAALGAARTALDVWTLAPNDPTAEQTVLLSLQAVRSLLQSFAPPPPKQTMLASPYNYKGVPAL